MGDDNLNLEQINKQAEQNYAQEVEHKQKVAEGIVEERKKSLFEG